MRSRNATFFLWLLLAVFALSASTIDDHNLQPRSEFEERLGEDVDTSPKGDSDELNTRFHDKRSGSERAPLHIRDELTRQAVDLVHEHGQDVDLSLEGYNHDLVARSLDKRDPGLRLGQSGKNMLSRMRPHHVAHKREAAARVALGDDVDYSLEGYDHSLVERDLDDTDLHDYGLDERAPGLSLSQLGKKILAKMRPNHVVHNRRAAFAQAKAAAREQLGDEIDYSLEGYDLDALDRRSFDEHEDKWAFAPDWQQFDFGGDNAGLATELEEGHDIPKLSRREAVTQQEDSIREQLGDGVDYSLEGYDHGLLERDLDEEEVDFSLEGYAHDLVGGSIADSFGGVKDEEDVDYSLEGYNHALVRRDLLPEEADDLDIDFSLEGYNHALVRRYYAEALEGARDNEDVDYTLTGYDEAILRRSLENIDVDTSLEGYNHELVARHRWLANEHGSDGKGDTTGFWQTVKQWVFRQT